MDTIISLDGPSAAGKGTIANQVAKALKWHLLSSGTIYRNLAMQVDQTNISIHNPSAIAQLAKTIPQRRLIRLSAEPSQEIQSERIGAIASILSSYPEVRAALLNPQRAFYRPPGLVAEGRDMSSVVFPQAGLKIYLTADIHARARRRIKQLFPTERIPYAKIGKIIQQLKERDQRDMNRMTAPLERVQNAININSTELRISEVTDKIIKLAKDKFNIK